MLAILNLKLFLRPILFFNILKLNNKLCFLSIIFGAGILDQKLTFLILHIIFHTFFNITTIRFNIIIISRTKSGILKSGPLKRKFP